MKLLIDIGNTNIKFAKLSGKAIVKVCIVAHKDVELSLTNFVEENLTRSITALISNVSSPEIGLFIKDLLGEAFGISALFVEPRKIFDGFETQYENPSKLGVDRWLGAYAAWSSLKDSVVVVDIGTAITIDFVDEGGCHFGGFISPGFDAMSRGMCLTTAKLNVPEYYRVSGDIPKSTNAAIVMGIHNSIFGSINHVYNETQRFPDKGFQKSQWVFTGGGLPVVSNKISWKHLIKPNLVLEGLGLFASIVDFDA